MHIFKKTIISFLSLSVLMTSMHTLIPASYAADTPTATATDVYISGNWVVGETLTAEYTYYDTAETTEDTANTTFQWYYVGSNTAHDTAISGATGKTYTLQESDAGKSIYFVVTPNGSGNGRKVSSAGYGTVQAANSTAISPTALNAVLALTDGYNKVMPDSKIKVHYAAAFFNDEEEGETTFQWYTSDALNKAEPTAIEGATAQTYTITEAEYGKYLYAEVVVKDESGDADAAISTGAVFVGNQLPIDGVNTSRYGSCWNEFAGVNTILSGFGGMNFIAARYASAEHSFVLDAETPVTFNGFKFSVYDSDIIGIWYSNDDENWTEVTQDKDGNALSTYTGTSYRTVHADIRLAAPITARYFRFRYKDGSTATIHNFFPYLTDEEPVITLAGDAEIEMLRSDVSSLYSEPGYAAEDAEDGDITDNVAITVTKDGSPVGNVDTSVSGEYIITYSVTDGGPLTQTATATRKVIVADGFRTEGDLAYGKTVTISAGSNPQSINDGNPNTMWACAVGTSDAVIDLGERILVSKFAIKETGSSLSNLKLLASEDGTAYTEAYVSATVGEQTVDFDPVYAQYLKIQVDSADENGKIHTFECYFDDLGRVKRAAQLLEIDADLTNVTEDLPLPDSGEYDTDIAWTSGNTSVVGNNGSVTRGTADENVTLTATIVLEKETGTVTTTKDFYITVIKKPEEIRPSGGGGGGGSYIVPPEPIVVPPVLPEVEEKTYSFTDVDESHWAYEYIEQLAANEIIGGFEDGTYAPDAQITRAQFLKMILDVLALSKLGTIEFVDVDQTDWFYNAVSSGYTLGVVSGIAENEFGPDLPIKRQDMAVIIAKALNCTGMPMNVTGILNYADKDEISRYAEGAVDWMGELKIMNGTPDGNFNPFSFATRAEAARIIFSLLEMKGGS